MANVYSHYKIFHFPEKLASLPREISEIRAPLHIRLKPINACNHSCHYCAYRKKDLQLGKDMQLQSSIPWDKMQELIEDFAEMKVGAITFSGGGEPFLYPHFTETLSMLIDKKIPFSSLTNGAMLSGERAELFAAKGTWIRISMDGWDNASYTRYRGVANGEFTTIMGNIAAFNKLKSSCLVGVSIIVDKDNYMHVYELIGRLKDLGVDSVKVSPCIISNSSQENNTYHDSFYRAAKEITQKAKADFDTASFEVYDCYHKLEIDFTKRYTWCPYCQILPVIGADLNVYTCQDKAYNLDSGLLGSIEKIRFKNFWFANKERFFSINPSRDCNHHCVADGKNNVILGYMDTDNDHVMFV